jgi:hypothetical protein
MAYGNSPAPEKRKAFAADYVEVADRIRAWYEAYPNARIETEIVSISDKLVVVKAQAFRGETPDEKPAGVGHSSMNIPGSTPYTRFALRAVFRQRLIQSSQQQRKSLRMLTLRRHQLF